MSFWSCWWNQISRLIMYQMFLTNPIRTAHSMYVFHTYSTRIINRLMVISTSEVHFVEHFCYQQNNIQKKIYYLVIMDSFPIETIELSTCMYKHTLFSETQKRLIILLPGHFKVVWLSKIEVLIRWSLKMHILATTARITMKTEITTWKEFVEEPIRLLSTIY